MRVYLSARTILSIARESYGTNLDKVAAARMRRQIGRMANDLESVAHAWRDELGEPAFSFRPEAGD